MKKKHGHMIHAGSLYFAIFISFIVTLLLGTIILYNYYNKAVIEYQIQLEQVESNANSGITLGLHDTSMVRCEQEVRFSLYLSEDSTDIITVEKKTWGGYQILRCIAGWKNLVSDRIALTGSDNFKFPGIALYLADQNNYLSISGNTKIKGKCYLPESGIRESFIEGQSYKGDKLVEGEISTSQVSIPDISHFLVSTNFNYLSGIFSEIDTLININEVAPFDTVKRSFSKNTLVIKSSGPLFLDRVCYAGNIRIYSSNAIYVTDNANLEDVILYAPVIQFEREFTGSLQAFAEDTLIVESYCHFSYPSCLGILNQSGNDVFMSIGDSSRITGNLMIFQEVNSLHPPKMKIGRNTTIHGMVYCPGTLELRGNIEGSAYCNKFGFDTGFAYYENQLLNVSIDRTLLSDFFAGAFIFYDYKCNKLIKWLN